MNKYQTPVNFVGSDFTVIDAISKAERRRVSDVIRNILEDAADGKIELSAVAREEKRSTSIRYDENLKVKIDALKEKTGLSIDRILHAAIVSLQAKGELN